MLTSLLEVDKINYANDLKLDHRAETLYADHH